MSYFLFINWNCGGFSVYLYGFFGQKNNGEARFMKIRQPAVEGSFYPSDINELDAMLNEFGKQVKVNSGPRPKAVIVPHAGLFYSGLTATFAYKYAQGHKYRSAVIFAPSHRVAFYGMSGADFDEYGFCGGNFKINRELTESLKKKNGLLSIEEAHLYEHSAEVQLPFIKKYINAGSLAVFVYGEYGSQELSYCIDDVITEGEDLVIISTDLSHFHAYEKCRSIDEKVIEGVKDLDLEAAASGEACGMTGITAMIQSAKTHKLKPEILDYRNSGDIIKDRSGVVGYFSAAFT
jgi:MEMO1 family protein